MAKPTTDVDEQTAAINKLMDRYGLDGEAAALVAAVECGDAMVEDVVFDPPLSREDMYRLGITMPIEKRIDLARRQARSRDESE